MMCIRNLWKVSFLWLVFSTFFTFQVLMGGNYQPKYSDLNTKWKASVDSNGKASLQYQIVKNGVAGSWQDAPPLKGVCYSPCQIGDSNKNGPNIGDWFWDYYIVDSSTNQAILNWRNLWVKETISGAEVKNSGSGVSKNLDTFQTRQDLDNIKAMGANMIRVYAMLPYQFNTAGTAFNYEQLFTHLEFLDECYERNIFVLVGYPTPAPFWTKGATCTPPRTDWETTVYNKFLEALGQHPAVMGFTMLNELDGQGTSYLIPSQTTDTSVTDQVTFYWDLVETMAANAKSLAPDKLIGHAFHEGAADGQCTEVMLPYINKAKSVDYWGINTYQTSTLDPVFEPNAGFTGSIGYNHLYNHTTDYPYVAKPVILTEIGWPATGHDAEGKIYSDSTTQTNTATMISNMIPKVYKEESCLGMFYFEYSDEWWGQPVPTVYEWNIGDQADGFPNGYWDIEGFGLYGVSKNPDIPVKTDTPEWPVNWVDDNNPTYNQVVYSNIWGQGPFPETIPVSERTPCTTALKTVWDSLNAEIDKVNLKVKGITSIPSSTASSFKTEDTTEIKADDSIQVTGVLDSSAEIDSEAMLAVQIGHQRFEFDSENIKDTRNGLKAKGNDGSTKFSLMINTSKSIWIFKASRVHLDDTNPRGRILIQLINGDLISGGEYALSEKASFSYIKGKNSSQEIYVDSSFKEFVPLKIKGSFTHLSDKKNLLNVNMKATFDLEDWTELSSNEMILIIDGLKHEINPEDWDDRGDKLIYTQKQEDGALFKVICNSKKKSLDFIVRKLECDGQLNPSLPLDIKILIGKDNDEGDVELKEKAHIQVAPHYKINLTEN